MSARIFRSDRRAHRGWRSNITFKLLVWCFALILVFYVSTAYVFWGLQNMVGIASEIVTVDFEVERAAERMIQHLISMQENRMRARILEDPQYLDEASKDLAAYGQALAEMRTMLPPGAAPWAGLEASYRTSLEPAADGEGLVSVAPDISDNWLRVISAERAATRDRMAGRLAELSGLGERIILVGLMTLTGALVVGILGSLVIAWRINRQLSQLKRGIREFTRGRPASPLTVYAQDELGRLTETFNEMCTRLAREEAMRSEFISMLSHEIRTPMTSVREAVNLMREGNLGAVTERQNRFLDIAAKELGRLSDLLTRLMQVSSITGESEAARTEPIVAGILLRDAAERMYPAGVAKRVRLTVRDETAGAVVAADVPQLSQVLVNLVGNAVKFSPPGGEVLLIARPGRRGGETVFCVQDQGPGIPEQERAYIFDRYWRGASAKAVDGAGLGLFISRRIIEAHGGQLWYAPADGGEGQGSSFCFSLPRAARNA